MPFIFGKYLQSAIGNAKDYIKNLKHQNFSQSINLSIPPSMISNKKLKDFDLSGVPNDIGLYENRESTGVSIPEEHCGELQPASALLPTDCFMPIKALN